MKLRLLIVLVVGLLVLGGTSWLTYPRKPKLSAAANHKYLHCEECPWEGTYTDADEDKPCPSCGSDKPLIPTVESTKETGSATNRFGRMTAILFVESIVLLGAIWFVLRPRDGDGHMKYLRMRCPKCGQKLRFTAKQIGQAGACSRCKRAFIFPAESLPDDEKPDEVEQCEDAADDEE